MPPRKTRPEPLSKTRGPFAPGCLAFFVFGLLFSSVAFADDLSPGNSRSDLAGHPPEHLTEKPTENPTDNPVEASGCAFRKMGEARVADVVDGDTVALDDGRQVRLVGMQAPKLPLGRKGFVAWPLADKARDEMIRLSKGKVVTLYRGDRAEDRHGRVLAQLATQDGKPVWLQAEMLRMGLARVYSFSDNRLCVGRLLEAEQVARARRAGIWALPFYSIRDASHVDELLGLAGTFQLVEGKVTKAAIVRGRLYLNFGEDYRTDFTVTVPPRQVKLFTKGKWAALLADGAGEMPIVGKRLRVRGWIDRYNGPEIVATHPEQVELLSAP